MTKVSLYSAAAPSVSSHTLRLRAASEFTGEPAETFTESAGPFGKPFFPSHPHVHFSVSHTGDLWVCAFAACEVGLDVQEYRENDDPARLIRLAKRWFSEGERRVLNDCGYDPAEFYRIWARKEAYVKFTGTGIGAGSFPELDVTRELPGCVMRDLVLPYEKNHAAALVCAEEFTAELREIPSIESKTLHTPKTGGNL